MALQQGQTTSFKVELLQGVHNFTASTGDTFKIALYEASASLGPTTTAYTTTGEITGTGYAAGGITLTNVTPTSSGTTAYTTFANASWPNATFTARGALIYNATEGNKSVCVLDFGSDKTATAQTFLVQFPAAGATTALVRIE